MFKDDFLWGASTAAYQIEGAAEREGRGQSIWDSFCQRPGAVDNAETGEIACDHFHRLESDVGLMKQMGLQAYRFSISWPRVIPEGDGDINPAGLQFYSRLVDLLLEAGITPVPTLFHWDYPLALHHRGGWQNPTSPRWFARYARVIGEALGDRVSIWLTINEPQVFAELGYGTGEHAPGLRLSLADRLRVAHHLILAHNMAHAELADVAPGSKVSWAPVVPTWYPYKPSDEQAARERTLAADGDSLMNLSWWNHAVVHGHYPSDGLMVHAPSLPRNFERDLDRTAIRPDFLGINLYHGAEVDTDERGKARERPLPTGAPRTAMGWPITPQALYWAAKFAHEQSGLPLMITENGMANLDWVAADGEVNDPQRIDYTRNYLLELARASRDGVPLLGYMHWSLMDNFEWAKGYAMRFGLIHVDYATQRRTIKASGHWYRSVIESGGRVLKGGGGSEHVGSQISAI